MLHANHCANCGRTVGAPEQHYCPGCGQPTPAHRIDWHFLGHEIEHSVLHMDRGVLYTLKSLMLRPGQLIRDYLEGRRANHVKPFLLVMIAATVMVFLGKLLGQGDLMGAPLQAAIDDSRAGGGNPGADAMLVARVFESVRDWMNHHIAAFTLILLPLEASAFQLAFRRYRELNYPEWLVITTFLTAQTMVLWVLAMLLERWYAGLSQLVMLPAMAYGVVSLVQFFKGQPRWKIALRAIWGYVLFFLVNFLLTVALVFVVLAMART
ncbi:DUF3667 domain-containing protein [Lysobacter tyrosinilyticus]